MPPPAKCYNPGSQSCLPPPTRRPGEIPSRKGSACRPHYKTLRPRPTHRNPPNRRNFLLEKRLPQSSISPGGGRWPHARLLDEKQLGGRGSKRPPPPPVKPKKSTSYQNPPGLRKILVGNPPYPSHMPLTFPAGVQYPPNFQMAKFKWYQPTSYNC
jgi:hypothetical protein